MKDLYLLYDIAQGGWFTSTGTRSSDWTNAVAYDRERALHLVSIHKSYDGQPTWVPVRRDDLLEAVNLL